jgi:transcriptional regulator with XRE-family HTH domain
MNQFRPAKRRAEVSIGESVRIVRELQGFSQNELARLSGIPQPTHSAIENDRVRLGVERAKVLARALRCHPAVLGFQFGSCRLKPRANFSRYRVPLDASDLRRRGGSNRPDGHSPIRSLA